MASRPPRSANRSPPRCNCKRPLFFSIWDFNSQIDWGSIRWCRTKESAKALSASYLVSPAAASNTRSSSAPSGQLAFFRGNAASNLLNLLPTGKLMLDDGEELLQFDWNRHHRRQDHDEGAVLLADRNLPGQGLDDFGALQEAVKVGQNQDCRAIRRPGR